MIWQYYCWIFLWVYVWSALRILFSFIFLHNVLVRLIHNHQQATATAKKSLKLQNIKYSWLIIVYVPCILFISLVLCGSKEIQLNRSMQMIKVHKFLTPKNMFHSPAYTSKWTGQKKNKMRSIYDSKIKWNFRISLYFSLGAADCSCAADFYDIETEEYVWLFKFMISMNLKWSCLDDGPRLWKDSSTIDLSERWFCTQAVCRLYPKYLMKKSALHSECTVF